MRRDDSEGADDAARAKASIVRRGSSAAVVPVVAPPAPVASTSIDTRADSEGRFEDPVCISKETEEEVRAK